MHRKQILHRCDDSYNFVVCAGNAQNRELYLYKGGMNKILEGMETNQNNRVKTMDSTERDREDKNKKDFKKRSRNKNKEKTFQWMNIFRRIKKKYRMR